ncbi:FGGY-family carbohydrate kinase [Breznakiella homolactica]|uniref:Xylulokinase n=1 Tax=Breznakiella homolactica TaxID=2798577 RepID=A0A7T7XJU3_9SPIR|nr:FGGY-family carbohydrate kinase [Breznakiella homolactica]QQO07734.1 hypothetical protein JFL75_12350 [Breznakiella homolactica]
MENGGIISVDIGTTSMRAVLLDRTGRILTAAQEMNPPDYFPGGRVEQDPRSWENLLPRVLRKCREEAESAGIGVEGISLASQRSSIIPLGKDRRPIAPAIMWQDTRAEPLCHALEPQQKKVYQKSGLKISTVFSAVKMKWLKEQRRAVYDAAWKITGIHDYVLCLLTGNLVTDRCIASRTSLLNLFTLDWDDELIGIFGLERGKLCDLIDQGSTAGTLTNEMARLSGLPAGLPVVSAGGDQQNAALGLGLLGPGDVIISTGTGSYVLGVSEKPVFDPGERVLCNVSAVPGGYILEAGALTMGTVYRWFTDTFYSPETGFSDVDNEARESPPGSGGVIVLPHFSGSGAPHWNPGAKGIFYNLGLNTRRGDLARAILEGIATEMADNADLIAGLSGLPETFRAAGGLSKSAVFSQIQADACGRPVVCSREHEATSLGAWISAAKNLGLFTDYPAAYESAARNHTAAVFHPVHEHTELYRKIRRKKQAIYNALTEHNVYDTDYE